VTDTARVAIAPKWDRKRGLRFSLRPPKVSKGGGENEGKEEEASKAKAGSGSGSMGSVGMHSRGESELGPHIS